MRYPIISWVLAPLGPLILIGHWLVFFYVSSADIVDETLGDIIDSWENVRS